MNYLPKRKRFGKQFGHWVLVVKENVSDYEAQVLQEDNKFTSGDKVHKLLWPRITEENVERMYILALDGRNHLVCLHELARGGLHGCSITIQDVLRAVLMAGVNAFVLAHNHPGGNPMPSPEDIDLTKNLCEASRVVGVTLVDHVIIGSSTEYKSMFDLGIL